MSEMLKVNSTLTSLNLGGEEEREWEEKEKEKEEWMTENGIGVEGAKLLSEMLKVNTILTSLNLTCEEERKREKRKREKRIMNDREWDEGRRSKITE